MDKKTIAYITYSQLAEPQFSDECDEDLTYAITDERVAIAAMLQGRLMTTDDLEPSAWPTVEHWLAENDWDTGLPMIIVPHDTLLDLARGHGLTCAGPKYQY